MRGLLIGLIFVGLLILALWMIHSHGKARLEEDITARDRAMVELTQVNLASLERIIMAFSGQEGRLPANLDELRKSRWLAAAMVDAWGRKIRYEAMGETSFRLTSSGSDGIFGTADDIIKNH